MFAKGVGCGRKGRPEKYGRRILHPCLFSDLLPLNGIAASAAGKAVELLDPVKGVTIAGKAFDILNALDMTGNDIETDRTFAVPSLRISEMQIGGK